MALEPRAVAALALHRFALGPREGSIFAIASDPRGALLAELTRPEAGQITASNLMSSGAANRAVYEFNAERLAKQRLEKARQEATQKDSAATGMAPSIRHRCRGGACAHAKPDATAAAATLSARSQGALGRCY